VELPEGLVAVVKADCPTCRLVRPVLDELGAHVVSEDDDDGLELSYRLGVETVPTLLRVRDGKEEQRSVGRGAGGRPSPRPRGSAPDCRSPVPGADRARSIRAWPTN